MKNAIGKRVKLTIKEREKIKEAIRKVHIGIANYGNPKTIDGISEKIEKLCQK